MSAKNNPLVDFYRCVRGIVRNTDLTDVEFRVQVGNLVRNYADEVLEVTLNGHPAMATQDEAPDMTDEKVPVAKIVQTLAIKGARTNRGNRWEAGSVRSRLQQAGIYKADASRNSGNGNLIYVPYRRSMEIFGVKI